MARHRRLAAGRRGHRRPSTTSVARTLLQMRVADFLVQAGAAGRAGAHLRARRADAERRRSRARRRSTPSCRRSAAPASPRSRSRPRCCCSTAASAAARPTCLVDLDFQHGACADYLDLEPRLDLDGDRAAAGAARPPAARSHAVAACLRPRGDRGAEPAGRNALVRSRRGDAAARPGVVAFRLCRDRHAAHLVLLDRQRAARLQQALHRQRDDGAGPAPRQAAGRGDPRAARRRAAAAGHRQSLRAADVRRRACARADIEQALGDDFAGAIPNNYQLVREAIDRGVPLDEVKPGNKITRAAPQADAAADRRRRPTRRSASLLQKLSLSLGAMSPASTSRT